MRNLHLSILVLFLFSCSSEAPINSKPTSEIDFEAEYKAIEQLRAKFQLALKEGRYQDMRQYASSEVKTIRPGGQGWDEMFNLGKERGRFPYDSMVMTPTETYIMNDSMAYDWGSSRVYYTNEEGEQVELRNSFLVILKKENGEWKLHREVGSSILE